MLYSFMSAAFDVKQNTKQNKTNKWQTKQNQKTAQQNKNTQKTQHNTTQNKTGCEFSITRTGKKNPGIIWTLSNCC